MATNGGRSAATQLRELGHAVPGEDDPRWHLTAAEEAMDGADWDAARVALQRARDNMAHDSAERIEARFVALRLAVATVDLRVATEETMALVECMDEDDDTWNRRVRRIIDAAPRVFTGSMRAGLAALLPPIPAAGHDSPAVVPIDTALDQPDEPDLFAPPAPVNADAGTETEYQVWVDDGDGDPVGDEQFTAAGDEPSAGRRWHIRVDPAADLEDATRIRDLLVERMLAEVTDEEFQVLFDTATTFLANGQYETAELMFSAAMQAPDLRVAACEGLVQALVRRGRYSEAIADATRATRVFAREGDALGGILYWQGVAAQEAGDARMAFTCFERVLAGPAAVAYPDVTARRERARA